MHMLLTGKCDARVDASETDWILKGNILPAGLELPHEYIILLCEMTIGRLVPVQGLL